MLQAPSILSSVPHNQAQAGELQPKQTWFKAGSVLLETMWMQQTQARCSQAQKAA